MVNNNFYNTINDLVKEASGGTASEVVDYSTFVDAGRTILQIQGSDLQNNFIKALMNKIALSINTARSYEGKYKDITKGTLEYGNTIEMIMNVFFDAQAASFVNLENGTSVDQYTINKPDAFIDYFIDSNAYTIPITIQYDQLEKAFSSPSAMDAFISGTIMYVMNSNEERKEAGRIGLVAKLVIDIDATEAAATENTPAQKYKLVTLYNQINNTQLTTANAIYNEDFIKFAVQTIEKVMSKTEKPSESFNLKGIKTFTPGENRHLYVNSLLSAAMKTYIYTNNYNPEYSVLKDYVDVAYWQDETDVLRIKYKKDQETVTSSPILAVMFDDYALGEWVKSETMDQSPFNARGRYWNNFLNVELRYCENQYANAVIFTLD